jgi:hypothetical protein
MDSTNSVILFWQPGLQIIQNKSWLHKSHMAHAWCVKFLQVCQWDIPHFHHSITDKIRMFTWSIWMKLVSMFRTLLVVIQSATNSDITLSVMSFGFGSLMNCITWVLNWAGSGIGDIDDLNMVSKQDKKCSRFVSRKSGQVMCRSCSKVVTCFAIQGNE